MSLFAIITCSFNKKMFFFFFFFFKTQTMFLQMCHIVAGAIIVAGENVEFVIMRQCQTIRHDWKSICSPWCPQMSSLVINNSLLRTLAFQLVLFCTHAPWSRGYRGCFSNPGNYSGAPPGIFDEPPKRLWGCWKSSNFDVRTLFSVYIYACQLTSIASRIFIFICFCFSAHWLNQGRLQAKGGMCIYLIIKYCV